MDNTSNIIIRSIEDKKLAELANHINNFEIIQSEIQVAKIVEDRISTELLSFCQSLSKDLNVEISVNKRLSEFENYILSAKKFDYYSQVQDRLKTFDCLQVLLGYDNENILNLRIQADLQIPEHKMKYSDIVIPDGFLHFRLTFYLNGKHMQELGYSQYHEILLSPEGNIKIYSNEHLFSGEQTINGFIKYVTDIIKTPNLWRN